MIFAKIQKKKRYATATAGTYRNSTFPYSGKPAAGDPVSGRRLSVRYFCVALHTQKKRIMACCLQVENLTKSFGDLVLFENISFAIEDGRRVALVAKNGTGKTTLLNIIAGREDHDGGSVVPRRDLRIAYLEQSPVYPAEMTVLEACFLSENPALKAIQADSVAAEDPRLRTAGRDPFGRTAQARGAGQRADKRVGPADPRRADQPPRHRYDRVARRVSGGKRRGAADGDARPLLSGQGVQRHPRNRGPAAIPLRGQLLLLSGEEAGARDGAGGPAGERNESLPPRAGVDAPPAAGAGDEGPVAHRRLSRAGNAPAIDAQPRRSAARRQGVADRDQDIRSQGGRQTVRRAGAPRQIQLQLHPLRETGDRGRQRLREIDVPQTADGDRTP